MKVLIIGLGSMGKRRIRMLLRLMCADSIFGVDTMKARRTEASTLYGIQCFDNLDTALDIERFDIGFICTSPLSHYKLTKSLLMAEMHVFSEINLINNGYEELIALANQYKKILFLSSTPMYRDEMCRICTEVTSERLLTYNYHVGQYLPDWHPWESYDNFFIGDKRTNGCREIFAIELPWMIEAFGEIQDIHVIKKRSTNLNIDYDDTYLVLLTHESGNTGVFCVDVTSRKATRNLEIYNQNIYITWNGTPDSLKKYNINTQSMQILSSMEQEEHIENYAEFINEKAYLTEVSAFLRCITGDEQPKHTLQKDAKILALIDRIEENL